MFEEGGNEHAREDNIPIEREAENPFVNVPIDLEKYVQRGEDGLEDRSAEKQIDHDSGEDDLDHDEP